MINLNDVCDTLGEFYHTPDLENKENPLDELMFIILAKKTAGPSFANSYNLLRKRLRTWDEVRLVNQKVIEKIIRPGGLSTLKSQQIKRILNQIYERNNKKLSLDFLHGYSDQEAEDYLMELHGVGIKTAKCVLMYSLKRKVLPVDIHTYRLAHELELIDKIYMRNEKGKLHAKLESIIPPDLRYKFHVNAVVHGREEHMKRIKPPQHCNLIQVLIAREVFHPSVQPSASIPVRL